MRKGGGFTRDRCTKEGLCTALTNTLSGCHRQPEPARTALQCPAYNLFKAALISAARDSQNSPKESNP